MSTQTLTIEVDDEAARLFRAASEQEQKKMEALISLWLKDFAASRTRPLTEVVRDIGEKAVERGMTADILTAILEADR